MKYIELWQAFPLLSIHSTWYFFLVSPQVRFQVSHTATKTCCWSQNVSRPSSLPATLDLQCETPNWLYFNSQHPLLYCWFAQLNSVILPRKKDNWNGRIVVSRGSPDIPLIGSRGADLVRAGWNYPEWKWF